MSYNQKKRQPSGGIPWDKIKDAYLLGEKSHVIAARYGLHASTIRVRSSRENWPTPRNIKVKIAEQINTIKVQQLKGDIEYGDAERQMDNLNQMAKSLAARQAEHRKTIEEIVGQKIRTNKVPAIKSWRDLDTADKIQRRTLDMDKDTSDAIINVGILGSVDVVDETKEGD